MTAQAERVFVYGSLKRGFHNHHFLEEATFLGGATTARSFDLWSLGAFPAVTQPGRFHVTGEVYGVDRDTLSELDLLEGEGILYKRKATEVSVGERSTLRAWIYVLLHREPGMRPIQPLACGITKAWSERHAILLSA